MHAIRVAPARLLAVTAVTFALAATLFAFTAAGPSTTSASALISPAKGDRAPAWAGTPAGSPGATCTGATWCSSTAAAVTSTTWPSGPGTDTSGTPRTPEP